jgi:hypothetical protein
MLEPTLHECILTNIDDWRGHNDQVSNSKLRTSRKPSYEPLISEEKILFLQLRSLPFQSSWVSINFIDAPSLRRINSLQPLLKFRRVFSVASLFSTNCNILEGMSALSVDCLISLLQVNCEMLKLSRGKAKNVFLMEQMNYIFRTFIH